ncbi:MCE family protein [Streptomyces zhihengii]|uniref:MCE family protein n=1 Tax=Streptomyces zhihengii TaxID=1818004 RepID=A0ABS2UM69_9ACTN|nr:MCE family protein [Streptomyces zhihengii]MBM9618138.1 MCE family protein [Streptomyces zhihengii]
MNTQKIRRRLAGVVFLLLPVLLVWLSVAVYGKQFSDDATVTVLTGAVGNEMHKGAEVKLRGVVVGEVRDIAADGRGARLTLAVKPGELDRVPADVTAQMLPTTLFGARFVALVPPAHSTTADTLKAGDTITQDRTGNAIELEQVLDNVLPLLTAVKPEKLSATLTAVAQALQGRGDQLGSTLETLEGHLERLNPHLPVLNRDITQLVEVSHLYADTAPGILDALTDFTVTSSTVADQQAELATLYGSTTKTAQDLTSFLRKNENNLIRLAAASRDTLELLAEYSPSFPCTLRTLAGFVPAMDKALGKGTDQPGLHVTVTSVPSLGKYVPGRDTPVYDATGGPHCYTVPYTGRPAPAAADAASESLGLPNSPQENQLVNELLAPGLGTAPAELPDWSSVLTGPVLRGTEVTLK